MTTCDDWNAAQVRRAARHIPGTEKLPDIPSPPRPPRQRIDTLDVIENWNLNFHMGSALNYIGCADLEGNAILYLEKAIYHLRREIDRRTKGDVYV